MINPKVKKGDIIKITKFNYPYGTPYVGRVGEVLGEDFLGQIHGTWGKLPLIPQIDEYELV